MPKLPAPHRRPGLQLPDLNDVFPFAPLSSLMPQMFSSTNSMMRVEEYVEGEKFVARVEIPGIDPDNDLDVQVHDGALTIRAERSQVEQDREHEYSEFVYGSFARTVPLPKGAREEQVCADYSNGILTVEVGMGEQPAMPKKIDVSHKS